MVVNNSIFTALSNGKAQLLNSTKYNLLNWSSALDRPTHESNQTRGLTPQGVKYAVIL